MFRNGTLGCLALEWLCPCAAANLLYLAFAVVESCGLWVGLLLEAR